jgi:hypothetical protein
LGRTINADKRTSLFKLRLRGLQRLVRDVDLLFKSVELRILEDLPPVPLAIWSLGCAVFQFGGNSLYSGGAAVAGRE